MHIFGQIVLCVLFSICLVFGGETDSRKDDQ